MAIARYASGVLLALFMVFMGVQKFTGPNPIFTYIADQSGMAFFEPQVRMIVGAAELACAAQGPLGYIPQGDEHGGERGASMARLTGNKIEALKNNLDAERYAIAFEEATEPPGSSPLNAEKRAGSYHCAVCGEALFGSQSKYDSGSGWPSFFAPIDEDVLETKRDFRLLLPRTEFHCANCGAHVGHVFKDGPPPTGQRWCANGAVLDFRPAQGED